MKNLAYPRWFAIAIIALLSAGVTVDAAPPVPAAPTTTLWNFLGIPQAMNRMRDGTSNRLGNRPNAERKPPIKRIADPANLESENPAIKKAAEIKADQDLAPQKIKAIKYLATIGCDGCYDGVKEALLAAMDDCTEEVRYSAAVAFCMVAGSPCNNCGKTCCNAEVMQKLQDKAFGQDEKCCYKESSPRVRAAAERALNACKRKVGPTAAPRSPEPVKGPEGPPEEPTDAPKDEPKPTPAVPASPTPATEPTSSLKILTPPEALEDFQPAPEEQEQEAGHAIIQASATEILIKPMPEANKP